MAVLIVQIFGAAVKMLLHHVTELSVNQSKSTQAAYQLALEHPGLVSSAMEGEPGRTCGLHTESSRQDL